MATLGYEIKLIPCLCLSVLFVSSHLFSVSFILIVWTNSYSHSYFVLVGVETKLEQLLVRLQIDSLRPASCRLCHHPANGEGVEIAHVAIAVAERNFLA